MRIEPDPTPEIALDAKLEWNESDFKRTDKSDPAVEAEKSKIVSDFATTIANRGRTVAEVSAITGFPKSDVDSLIAGDTTGYSYLQISYAMMQVAHARKP